MANLRSLISHIDDYRSGKISVDEFEDYFRDDSRGAYSVSELENLCVAIESLLSDYRFGPGIEETVLRSELAAAIRPFEDSWRNFATNSTEVALMPIPGTSATNEFISYHSHSVAA